METFFNQPWFFWASFIFGTAVVAVDLYLSTQYQKFGGYEANKLWANKDGEFVAWRYLAFWVPLIGSSLFLKQHDGLQNLAGVLPLTVGVPGLFLVLKHRSGMKRDRAEQLRILAGIRALLAESISDPIHPRMQSLLRKVTTRAKGGRVMYKLFPWIWVEGNDQGAAVVPLRILLIEYARSNVGP